MNELNNSRVRYLQRNSIARKLRELFPDRKTTPKAITSGY